MIFLYVLVYGVISKVNKQYKLFLSPTQTVQSLSSLSSYFKTCPVYGQCLDPHLAGASMAAVMDRQTVPDCTLPPLVC